MSLNVNNENCNITFLYNLKKSACNNWVPNIKIKTEKFSLSSTWAQMYYNLAQYFHTEDKISR